MTFSSSPSSRDMSSEKRQEEEEGTFEPAPDMPWGTCAVCCINPYFRIDFRRRLVVTENTRWGHILLSSCPYVPQHPLHTFTSEENSVPPPPHPFSSLPLNPLCRGHVNLIPPQGPPITITRLPEMWSALMRPSANQCRGRGFGGDCFEVVEGNGGGGDGHWEGGRLPLGEVVPPCGFVREVLPQWEGGRKFKVAVVVS